MVCLTSVRRGVGTFWMRIDPNAKRILSAKTVGKVQLHRGVKSLMGIYNFSV